jgi:hypothetical protein
MIALTAEWLYVWIECNIEMVGLGSGMVCTAYGAFLVRGRMSDEEGEEDVVLFKEDGFSQN